MLRQKKPSETIAETQLKSCFFEIEWLLNGEADLIGQFILI